MQRAARRLSTRQLITFCLSVSDAEINPASGLGRIADVTWSSLDEFEREPRAGNWLARFQSPIDLQFSVSDRALEHTTQSSCNLCSKSVSLVTPELGHCGYEGYSGSPLRFLAFGTYSRGKFLLTLLPFCSISLWNLGILQRSSVSTYSVCRIYRGYTEN